MKNRLLALFVAFSLAACGGGGSPTSSQSPAPAPSPSPSNCTDSPAITAATTYIGVLPNGLMGQWQFNTATLSASYTVAGNTYTPTLTQDTASCSYTGSTTGTLRTSFLSNGLAVSAAAYNGGALPALLISSPESELSNLAGTYNVLRYTTETTSATTVTSDYMTFNVDGAGNWQACPNAAYSATCGGPTGTLSANVGGGFDIVMGGITVGRMLAKVSGLSKVFVVSINNNSNPSDLITGMWLGSLNASFVSGADDGAYVTESTDPASNVITISGLTGHASDSTSTAMLTANEPVQGTFSINGGEPTADIGILSSLGLYAAITPAAGSSAYMQFGVKK